MQIKYFTSNRSIVILTIMSILLFNITSAKCAGGLIDLDSEARRSIRDAELDRFGTKKNHTNTNSPSITKEESVTINNNTNVNGDKKCIMSIGNVKNIQNTKGMRQENITYVDGSVINVCE
jgi:hypothetical protein